MTAPAALLVLCASALGPVELRGAGVPVIDDPVVAVGPGGVTVGGGTTRIISWDLVRRVTGEHAQEAERFARLSEDAWRARSRLDRGDYALATPLFESLFAAQRGENGPTALVIAEGLLRCRLHDADLIGAIEPWLEAVRLHDAGFTHPADQTPSRAPNGVRPALPSFRPVDEELALAPGLPPMFLDLPDVRAFAASPAPASPSDTIEALRALYLRAARFEAGVAAPEPEIPPDTAQRSGVRFVTLIVNARAGDAVQRKAARSALEAGLDQDAGTWREAWRRAAIGRSLLLEPDAADRQRGVIQLLHLPARFGGSQPYLAGVALAEASRELAREGDRAGAAALREELLRRDPRHPAVRWLDAAESAPPVGPAPTNESGDGGNPRPPANG